MMYATKGGVWKQSFIDKFLAALSAVPGGALIGATPKVHLYAGSLVPTPQNVIGDFTALECNFTGYVAQTLNIVLASVNPVRNVRADLAIATFGLSGTTTTQNANGYWVDAGASPDWIIAERFPQPMPFANPGDFLDLSLMFALACLLPSM